jgi:hypothetical protein
MTHSSSSNAVGACLILMIATAILLSASALAAERIVLAEDFTTTWGVYCPYAGRALHLLLVNHPTTLTFVQIHREDAFAIPWGTSRHAYYGGGTYPTIWFDGALRAWDLLALQVLVWYDHFLALYEMRRNTPTDVALDVGGELLGDTTYRITVRVRLDPNGTAKTVRVYVLHALDHYPSSSDNRYRNCVRPPAPPDYVDVTLEPDDVVDALVWDCSFDATSMTRANDIRILAWAQQPAASGAEGQGGIWNARMVSWPLSPLPPRYELGDLNCDGLVSFDDVNAFVMALSDPAGYPNQYPNCDLLNGDCDRDGDVDFDDIDPFVALLSRA